MIISKKKKTTDIQKLVHVNMMLLTTRTGNIIIKSVNTKDNLIQHIRQFSTSTANNLEE